MPRRTSPYNRRRPGFGHVTVELRFDDGLVLARVTEQGKYSGATYRPVALNTLSSRRAVALLDALLAELGPAQGGDVVAEQLLLWGPHAGT